MTFRHLAPVAALLATLGLSACALSERAAIAAYFEESQGIAERMAQVGAEFETLMEAQENPLEWSDEDKAALATHKAALDELHDKAASMSVPEAFVDVHPLLVRSIGEMVAAVDIIRAISEDATLATKEKGDEMTAHAEEGERLANEYVQKLEQVLQEKYPEMMEEA
jgi:hypothetical protein